MCLACSLNQNSAALSFKMYADRFSKPYLDRVVMEVCYHYFIFVIHSHKVRTWNQQRKKRGEKRGKMSHLVFFNV